MRGVLSAFETRRFPHAVVGVLLLLIIAGCQTDLYKNVDERQANDMVATLAHHGIVAQRHYQDDGTVTLTVDKNQFADAVDILRDAGLPKQRFQSMGELFKQSGLVSSPAQQHARMIYALGQELSHTISEIDGVLSARVQVVLPDNDLMQHDRKPSSASVFIRYNRSFDVQALTPRIKKLVSDSVSGLDYDHVSIVAVRAATRPSDTDSMRDISTNTSFLGLSIARSSVVAARWLFGGLILLVLGMACAIGWLLRPERDARKPYALDASSSNDA